MALSRPISLYATEVHSCLLQSARTWQDSRSGWANQLLRDRGPLLLTLIRSNLAGLSFWLGRQSASRRKKSTPAYSNPLQLGRTIVLAGPLSFYATETPLLLTLTR